MKLYFDWIYGKIKLTNYLKKVLIIICNAMNPCSVTILILF